MPKAMDPFDHLKLAPAFDLPNLEEQFLMLQKQEHPDLFVGDRHRKEEAEVRFARIVWAYEELKDPLKRAQLLFERAGVWPIPQDLTVLEELMEAEEQFGEGQLSPEQIRLWSYEALDGLGRSLAAEAFQEAAAYYLRFGTFRRLERQGRRAC